MNQPRWRHYEEQPLQRLCWMLIFRTSCPTLATLNNFLIAWLKNKAAPFLILSHQCSSFFMCHPVTFLARGAGIMGMAPPPPVIIWWIKKGWDPVGDFPELEYCSVLWKCWTVGWAMRRASNLSPSCIDYLQSFCFTGVELKLLQIKRAG